MMTGTTSTLRLFSPAKINLFLHITGRRDNGYHNLQSVFRALNFGDELTFCTASRPVTADTLVRLFGADALTESPSDNLITKAVFALYQRYRDAAIALDIQLTKRIPTGAGLGGGSSNCATTLIAVNKLWQLNLNCQQLIDIGATLGADVPFFIFAHFYRTDALAEGIGEHLSAIRLPKSRYLLLLPPAHLSTAQFFSAHNLRKNCPNLRNIPQRSAEFGDRLSADFYNVFEPVAIKASAIVADALNHLKQLEPISQTSARMSGTGSTVFLPLPDFIDDITITSWQAAAPCASVIAENLY